MTVRERVAAMYEAGLSAIEHRLNTYPPPPPKSEQELLTACAIYLRGRAAAARSYKRGDEECPKVRT